MTNTHIRTSKTQGFGIVEIVLGVAILSSTLLSFFLVYQKALQFESKATSGIQASFLLEEGVEAVKFLRDESWADNIVGLTVDTSYFLVFTGSAWATSTADTYIDGRFSRSFVLADVYRDANDDISASGSLDVGSRRLTVTVAWADKGGTTTKSMATYITNILNN